MALVQVGVIVAGVLAAGACHRWYTAASMNPPAAVDVLADYGFVGLVVPVAWAAIALLVQRRSEDPFIRTFTFCSGIVVALLLALIFGQLVVRPMLRLVGG